MWMSGCLLFLASFLQVHEWCLMSLHPCGPIKQHSLSKRLCSSRYGSPLSLSSQPEQGLDRAKNLPSPNSLEWNKSTAMLQYSPSARWSFLPEPNQYGLYAYTQSKWPSAPGHNICQRALSPYSSIHQELSKYLQHAAVYETSAHVPYGGGTGWVGEGRDVGLTDGRSWHV